MASFGTRIAKQSNNFYGSCRDEKRDLLDTTAVIV